MDKSCSIVDRMHIYGSSIKALPCHSCSACLYFARDKVIKLTKNLPLLLIVKREPSWSPFSFGGTRYQDYSFLLIWEMVFTACVVFSRTLPNPTVGNFVTKCSPTENRSWTYYTLGTGEKSYFLNRGLFLVKQRGLKMVLAYVTNIPVKMNMFRTRCMLFYFAKTIELVSWGNIFPFCLHPFLRTFQQPNPFAATGQQPACS